jgi:phospholipid transport system substrate-binding protein
MAEVEPPQLAISLVRSLAVASSASRRIEVADARAVKSYYEVITTAFLRGESPFEVRFQVSDKSGRLLFFNIIIEGVNMLASERTEIGAMLDRQGGNLDALIAELQTT